MKLPLKLFPSNPVAMSLIGVTSNVLSTDNLEFAYNKRAVSILRFEIKVTAPVQREDQHNLAEDQQRLSANDVMESLFHFRVLYFRQKYNEKTKG